MYSTFSNQLYKINEGSTWNLSSRHNLDTSKYLLLFGVGQAPRRRSGPAASVYKSSVRSYRWQARGPKSGGEGTSKAEAEPNQLCGGAHCAIPSWRSRSCQRGSLCDATAAGRLAHPPTIPHCSSFPLAIGRSWVACNPRVVYRVVVTYHRHWLFWRLKKLGFTPESKQEENKINSDTMAI
jgi:hypothetical protein